MQPKVSVIVPVYNVEKFLEQCLDSILDQTLENIEVICVNDGSTDNSSAILEKYAKKDPRVKVITQENSGMSSARNTGMRYAVGKYVAFVDSDDFIATDMMEKLYSRAEATDAEITVGDLLLYFHDTKETAFFRDQSLYLFLKNKVFSIKDYPEFVTNIAVWDRIYLRSFLESIHASFPVGMIYEDWHFTVYALSHAKRIAVVPEQFYYYRKNAGGSITDNEAKQIKHKRDFLQITKMVLDIFGDDPAYAPVRNTFIPFMFNYAHMHQHNCKKYSLYKEFFEGMHALLTEDDYKNLSKHLPQYAKYINYLKANLSKKAYNNFRRTQYLYRSHDGHIYFRFSPAGIPHKIL